MTSSFTPPRSSPEAPALERALLDLGQRRARGEAALPDLLEIAGAALGARRVLLRQGGPDGDWRVAASWSDPAATSGAEDGTAAYAGPGTRRARRPGAEQDRGHRRRT